MKGFRPRESLSRHTRVGIPTRVTPHSQQAIEMTEKWPSFIFLATLQQGRRVFDVVDAYLPHGCQVSERIAGAQVAIVRRKHIAGDVRLHGHAPAVQPAIARAN